MILKRNTVLTLVTIFSYSFLFFSCNQDDNQGLMMAKSKKDNFTINFDLGNSEKEVPTYFLSFRLVVFLHIVRFRNSFTHLLCIQELLHKNF